MNTYYNYKCQSSNIPLLNSAGNTLEKLFGWSSILPLACCVFLFACNKLVEVEPPATSTNADAVYRNDASAIATLNNIYTTMSQQGITSGMTSMSFYPSLSADELRVFDNVADETIVSFYDNNLAPSNNLGGYWAYIYSGPIFFANSAIEGLTNTTSLTEKVRRQLLGEALFVRAFSYFYLVNLYGDVPLVLNSDYRKNSNIGRTAKADVYVQIVKDLTEARALLSENYLNGTLLGNSDERIAPTKWAAIALLARAYLYTGDWTNAEMEASNVIDEKALFDTVSLNQVFLVNNRESIWQLQSVSIDITNTSDAVEFLAAKNFFPAGRVHLSSSLVNSFETGDLRRTQWIDSIEEAGQTYYLPGKYKEYLPGTPVTERTVILRLAEQYLIRAEARLKKGDITGALSDINVIRSRAGLHAFTLTVESAILTEIVHQRKVELFTEWGHRWLDLKRLSLADQVLGAEKGSRWQSTDQLYPIPFTEIQQNVALQGHQNPGY